MVLAKEKDGTVHFCIDYQKVNGVTLKDPYPLLRIKDCLDALCGFWWFCTFLYIASGYWQVEMTEKDKEKTAFSMVAGLYQFSVMPFALLRPNLSGWSFCTQSRLKRSWGAYDSFLNGCDLPTLSSPKELCFVPEEGYLFGPCHKWRWSEC